MSGQSEENYARDKEQPSRVPLSISEVVIGEEYFRLLIIRTDLPLNDTRPRHQATVVEGYESANLHAHWSDHSERGHRAEASVESLFNDAYGEGRLCTP